MATQRNLGFKMIFAPTYDPGMKRNREQKNEIQQRWDSRKQKRSIKNQILSDAPKALCSKI